MNCAQFSSVIFFLGADSHVSVHCHPGDQAKRNQRYSITNCFYDNYIEREYIWKWMWKTKTKHCARIYQGKSVFMIRLTFQRGSYLMYINRINRLTLLLPFLCLSQCANPHSVKDPTKIELPLQQYGTLWRYAIITTLIANTLETHYKTS